MNPNPPGNQHRDVPIFVGANAGEIDTRRQEFIDRRIHLRKWHIPDYCQGEHFEAWMTKMFLIFQDAQLLDVANGTAIEVARHANDSQIAAARRDMYDECDSQVYSFTYRSLSVDNGGIVDSSGVPTNKGHLLLKKLTEINNKTTADNIPILKSNFLNPLKFNQPEDMSLEQWAKNVRSAATILTSNGHPMSEVEKSMVFRSGLYDKAAHDVLILPSRTETFEELIQTARTYFNSKTTAVGSSDKIFLTTTTKKSSIPCPYCLRTRKKTNYHLLSDCNNKVFDDTGQYPRGQKRSADEAEFPHIQCVICKLYGHYSNKCPSRSNGNGRGDGGGRGQFGRGRGNYGRGGRGYNSGRGTGTNGAYQLTWIPHEEENGNPVAAAQTHSANAVAAANNAAAHSFMLDANFSPFFAGMVSDYSMFTDIGLGHFLWIFDSGCTTNCTFLKGMFSTFRECSSSMNAANGSVISITGEGDCYSVHRVKYSPQLSVSLFSQRQAMEENATITLSTDGRIYTVVTAPPESMTLSFVYNGHFWMFEDKRGMKACAISPRPTGADERKLNSYALQQQPEWIQEYEERLKKQKKYPVTESRQVRFYINEDDDNDGDKGGGDIIFNSEKPACKSTGKRPAVFTLNSTKSASGKGALGTDVAKRSSNRSASGKGALGTDVARGSRLDVSRDIGIEKGRKDIKALSTLSSMDVPRPVSIYMEDISNRSNRGSSNRSNSVPNDTTDSALAAAVSGAVHMFLLWHFRLGHINYAALYAAIQSGQLTGFPYSLVHVVLKYLPVCRICQLMKNRHRPILYHGRMHQLRSGLVYYCDAKTIRVKSYHGERYIFAFLDDHGMAWIYLLKKKSDALNYGLKKFVNEVTKPEHENNFTLIGDNAGETTSLEFQLYCINNSIRYAMIPAYRHQYNGVVERFFQTIWNMTLAMLETSCLPTYLWGYALMYALMIWNAVPRGPDMLSNNFRRYGIATDVSNLSIFGCKVFLHINRDIGRGTLEARGEEARLIAVSLTDPLKCYFFRPRDNRIVGPTDDYTKVEMDIQLPNYSGNMQEQLEALQPVTDPTELREIETESVCNRGESHNDQLDLTDTAALLLSLKKTSSSSPGLMPHGAIRKTVSFINRTPGPALDGVSNVDMTLRQDPSIVTPIQDHLTPLYVLDGASEKTSSSPSKKTSSSSSSTSSKKTSSSSSSTASTASSPMPFTHVFTVMLACFAAYSTPTTSTSTTVDQMYNWDFDYACHAANCDPQSYTEAMRSPAKDKWQEAMDNETNYFWENGIWRLVPIDPSWNLLDSKWVYKLKHNEDGSIERYRSRIVAKGFLQHEGIDYGEVFSPVVRYSTLRLILALCAHYGMYKRHLDCPKAFTQAELDTPVYMKAPAGVKIPFGMCFEMLKSIYGLKQAGRLFYQLVLAFLLTLGFICCPGDTCLMYLVEADNLALIMIYVDDLLLCTLTKEFGDILTEKLTAKFNCKDLGEITYCLGIHIVTSPCRYYIALDLDRYIKNMITKYEFDDLQPLPTPMVHDVKLTHTDSPTTDEEKEKMSYFPFRSAISAVMYAMIALRADISFAVISLSRFTSNHGMSHWNALVRVFQYLKGTSHLAITYSRMQDTPAPFMYGYSDADWATSDVDERRSCIGYCIIMSGAVVFWLTRFWKPCLSTFESEIGGVTEISKEIVSARTIMEPLPLSWHDQNKDIPTTVLVDSSSAKQATDNPRHNSRSKHMEVIIAWIRHIVQEGWVRTQTIPRDDNLSDFFVKAYAKGPHREVVLKLFGPHQNLKIRASPGELLKKRKQFEE
jgi:hypothetical protein